MVLNRSPRTQKATPGDDLDEIAIKGEEHLAAGVDPMLVCAELLMLLRPSCRRHDAGRARMWWSCSNHQPTQGAALTHTGYLI